MSEVSLHSVHYGVSAAFVKPKVKGKAEQVFEETSPTFAALVARIQELHGSSPQFSADDDNENVPPLNLSDVNLDNTSRQLDTPTPDSPTSVLSDEVHVEAIQLPPTPPINADIVIKVLHPSVKESAKPKRDEFENPMPQPPKRGRARIETKKTQLTVINE